MSVMYRLWMLDETVLMILSFSLNSSPSGIGNKGRRHCFVVDIGFSADGQIFGCSRNSVLAKLFVLLENLSFLWKSPDLIGVYQFDRSLNKRPFLSYLLSNLYCFCAYKMLVFSTVEILLSCCDIVLLTSLSSSGDRQPRVQI